MRDVSYTPDEKLSVAQFVLEEVGVDRIEIASAQVSAGERAGAETVLRWANAHGVAERVEILGYTDGEASARWIADLGGKVMNVLAKGSLRHLTTQLRKTPEQHRCRTSTTRCARRGGSAWRATSTWRTGRTAWSTRATTSWSSSAAWPIRRSCASCFRTPWACCRPAMVTEMVEAVLGRFPDRHFDFHAHNDYGLATANTLAAVAAGRRRRALHGQRHGRACRQRAAGRGGGRHARLPGQGRPVSGRTGWCR